MKSNARIKKEHAQHHQIFSVILGCTLTVIARTTPIPSDLQVGHCSAVKEGCPISKNQNNQSYQQRYANHLKNCKSRTGSGHICLQQSPLFIFFPKLLVRRQCNWNLIAAFVPHPSASLGLQPLGVSRYGRPADKQKWKGALSVVSKAY